MRRRGKRKKYCMQIYNFHVDRHYNSANYALSWNRIPEMNECSICAALTSLTCICTLGR